MVNHHELHDPAGSVATMAAGTPLTERTFRREALQLAARDQALGAIVDRHGLPKFWARAPGFPTLLLLILEQQVSLASAKAAFDRLAARLTTVTPEGLLSLGDDELRADGFSRQKTRYARGLAGALVGGELDLDALRALDDDAARCVLVALPGIGPWTADVYLLSALRRPDVWPCGDLALQESVRRVCALDRRPAPDELLSIGERWRPQRASAARLLWHLYLSERRDGGTPAR